MRIKFVAISIVTALVLGLSAWTCSTPPEVSVRDGIAAANGYIVSARNRHPECDPKAHPENQSQGNCQVIRKTTEANNVAIDALETFCGSPAFETWTGPCTPPNKKDPAYQQLLNKLVSAGNNLNQTASDIKKLAQ